MKVSYWLIGPKTIKNEIQRSDYFPDLINNFINHGLVSKALSKNILEVQTWNPRNLAIIIVVG